MVHLTMVTMADHSQQWYFWPCFWKMAPWLTMVNHDTFDHGQKWYFWPSSDHAFEKWHHGWPWSTMVRCDHGWPWSNVVLTTMLWLCFWLWADHGHWPWSDFDHGQKHGLWQWCHFSKARSTMVKTHVWTIVEPCFFRLGRSKIA